MIVGRFRNVELHEDAADVLLDRSFRDEELVRDAGIRPAFGHEREHIALPG